MLPSVTNGIEEGQEGFSSRVHEEQFRVSRVTKPIFAFSRFSKVEVVKNVKNVTVIPFVKQSASIIFKKTYLR